MYLALYTPLYSGLPNGLDADADKRPCFRHQVKDYSNLS